MALLIGISLGLIGGGGSTLTLPILVYWFELDAVQATSYSLFVVGIASGLGGVRYSKQQLVDWSMVAFFGIPSLLTVFAIRALVLPVIPETILSLGNFSLSKDNFIMVLFAALMLAASYSMIRSNIRLRPKANMSRAAFLAIVMLEAIVVGALTALVGAGGGFLIIPALVIFGGLGMKKAIGTSLVIISLKSLTGFAGDLVHLETDWGFLLLFTALAALGIYIGMYAAKHISGKSLQRGFGWVVLFMAVVIIGAELW